MDINTVKKRKQLRRKFKRRAAALMGVAIMTGAALSGIPANKALAAEAPSNPPPQGWHQHKHSWPGADENQGWSQDGKIYYRSDDNPDSSDVSAYSSNNPVDYVKDSAAIYGFDSSRDSFTLLSVSRRSALVEVRQQDTGKLTNVLLKRTYDQEWAIVDVHAL